MWTVFCPNDVTLVWRHWSTQHPLGLKQRDEHLISLSNYNYDSDPSGERGQRYVVDNTFCCLWGSEGVIKPWTPLISWNYYSIPSRCHVTVLNVLWLVTKPKCYDLLHWDCSHFWRWEFHHFLLINKTQTNKLHEAESFIISATTERRYEHYNILFRGIVPILRVLI